MRCVFLFCFVLFWGWLVVSFLCVFLSLGFLVLLLLPSLLLLLLFFSFLAFSFFQLFAVGLSLFHGQLGLDVPSRRACADIVSCVQVPHQGC